MTDPVYTPLYIPSEMYFSPKKLYALRDAVLSLALALPYELGVDRTTIVSVITLLKE